MASEEDESSERKKKDKVVVSWPYDLGSIAEVIPLYQQLRSLGLDFACQPTLLGLGETKELPKCIRT